MAKNKYGSYKITGIPIVAATVTRGNKYFVHSGTGQDNANYGTKINLPFATEDYAIGKCTADRGDIIEVLAGHSRTTGKTTADVAGVTIRGHGEGLARPSLTTATADDVVTITANNVVFENFHFAAPGIDAVTAMINVTGAGCTVRNITGVGSASAMNVVDCITIGATTADDLLIENVQLFNAVVAVNSFLSFEAAASRVTIRNFFAFGDVATGGVIDAAKIDYLVLEDVNVGVVGTTKPAITLDSNPEGYARNCNFAGTHGTLATNANLGNLMRLFDIRVTEETDGSAQGALIPAVDTD